MTTPGPMRVSADGMADEREVVWVARIRAGDQAAFEELFETYATPMWQLALGYVKSRETADEIVQDVLARVWERRAEWVVREGIRPYLMVSVRNAALRVLRHQRVVSRWETAASTDITPSGMSQGPRPVDERLRRQEIEEAVQQAISRLPRRRREAYLLRWQHHMTNPEIAQVMGISLRGVELAIGKAMKTLRRELAAYH